MSSNDGSENLSLEVVQLPPCKFWPVGGATAAHYEPGKIRPEASSSRDILHPPGWEAFGPPPGLEDVWSAEHFCQSADDEFWTDDFGLHPNSPLWAKAKVMMIRNIPARCAEQEVVDFIRTITTDFVLEMPRSSFFIKGCCMCC